MLIASASAAAHHIKPAVGAEAAGSAAAAASSSTLFSEQVGHVIELFQDWNDCERSVSLFAVLKRIPFSCTKFLQSVIAANLTQVYGCCEQSKQLEHNANSVTFVRALHEAYRCLESGDTTDITGLNNNNASGSLFSGEPDEQQNQQQQQRLLRHVQSQSNHNHNFSNNHTPLHLHRPDNARRGSGASNSSSSGGCIAAASLDSKCSSQTPIVASSYDRKEDILGDILTLMPILTPGNEEAKSAYLDLIPATVEDAVRGTVNTSLVQQIFSYVLIHPAFSADDRR